MWYFQLVNIAMDLKYLYFNTNVCLLCYHFPRSEKKILCWKTYHQDKSPGLSTDSHWIQFICINITCLHDCIGFKQEKKQNNISNTNNICTEQITNSSSNHVRYFSVYEPLLWKPKTTHAYGHKGELKQAEAHWMKCGILGMTVLALHLWQSCHWSYCCSLKVGDTIIQLLRVIAEHMHTYRRRWQHWHWGADQWRKWMSGSVCSSLQQAFCLDDVITASFLFPEILL